MKKNMICPICGETHIVSFSNNDKELGGKNIICEEKVLWAPTSKHVSTLTDVQSKKRTFRLLGETGLNLSPL